MVEIGRDAGRETVAFLTDMNQPLGFAIGNALEVKEAIETLSGNVPKDLEELVLQLASHMVVLAKKAANTEVEATEVEVVEEAQACDSVQACCKADSAACDSTKACCKEKKECDKACDKK